MSNTVRFASFLAIALGVWALVHIYVFWRLASVPWVAAHVSRRVLFTTAAALWVSYPLARMLTARHWLTVGVPLEFVAATWVGIVFLLFSALVVTDVVTLGGFLWPGVARTLRGWAIIVGLAFSVIALAQGLRPPVVRDYEVQLAGLPKERDGLLVVVVSDVHLGTLIGERWMTRLVNRVNDMKPDLVIALGDILDGEADHMERLLAGLKKMRAPLGVWAVTGNHEFYVGVDRSVRLLEAAGYNVLRDRCAEVAPGLVLAGVDDLSARRQLGLSSQSVKKTLANRPPGATILLSHTPSQMEAAAAEGVGLMLSAHTHGGQIWPFNFLVRLSYKLLAGRYQVEGMTVIVCRGSGTWGPRMRLWHPGEILRIRLKAAG